MNRSIPLVFVLILTASSLIMVNPTWAQTKPSVPEFTLKFVDNSYAVPPTYGIDQYTGKTVITQSGYYQENTSIEVMIKNQPFIAYTDASGHFISLYYNFTFKGHYGVEWSTYRDPHYWAYVNASHSDYTVISFPLESSEFSDVSAGGQVDFRVEALIGYQTTTTVPTPWGPGYTYEFTGESSGWSSIKTITIPDTSASASPTPSQSPSSAPSSSPTTSSSPTQQPTSEPTQSANPTTAPTSSGIDPLPYILAIVALVIVAITFLGLTIYFRKQRNKKTAN